MEELYRVLAELQANSAALNAQAWGYHWNTEGRMFKQDHAFLLEMYEDFGDAIEIGRASCRERVCQYV